MDRRTKLLLLDMQDNAKLAITFLGARNVAEVSADLAILYAINRAVEIVGEAASKVDVHQRQQMPSIPWRDAINMRNLLIHGYDRVKVQYVVDTVRTDFPPLIAEIERILQTP